MRHLALPYNPVQCSDAWLLFGRATLQFDDAEDEALRGRRRSLRPIEEVVVEEADRHVGVRHTYNACTHPARTSKIPCPCMCALAGRQGIQPRKHTYRNPGAQNLNL